MPPIRAARLVTPIVGWALTDRDLRLTTTGGTTWTTVTPPGVPAARILGAAFLDAAHGWTAVAGTPDGTQRTGLDLLRSADGGRSWRQASLAGPDRLYTAAPAEAATIDFLDAQHGWIAIRLASSSNFSRGRLFQTTDGGATWQQRTTPIGDPVRFVTPTDGWAAGGPGGGHLYVSRDGGRSWQASTVAAPSAFAKSAVTYSLPTFIDPQTGVLPVTFAGDDATPPGLGFYQTRDGGGSWTLAQVITLDGLLGVGVTARTAVFGPAWLVARPGASRLAATADGGHSTHEVASAGLPPNIADLTFADAANGWARVADSECPGAPQVAKGGYRSTPIQLLRTSDGGRTWVPLGPRCVGATGCYRPVAPTHRGRHHGPARGPPRPASCGCGGGDPGGHARDRPRRHDTHRHRHRLHRPRGVWARDDAVIDWAAILPPPGFRGVLPRRWIVERTFAWLGQNRRFSKDFERLSSTGEALIDIAMTRPMPRRLART